MCLAFEEELTVALKYLSLFITHVKNVSTTLSVVAYDCRFASLQSPYIAVFMFIISINIVLTSNCKEL